MKIRKLGKTKVEGRYRDYSVAYYPSDSFMNSVTKNLRIFLMKMNVVNYIRVNKQTQFLEKFVDS